MKFKTILIGIGIAAAAAGCSTQAAQDENVSAPVDSDSAITETTVGETPVESSIDEAALQELLANMSVAEAPAEIVLDEEALADFFEADMATTESGLQYAIVEEGNGEIPEAGSVVQMHYSGKLADGTVFDSSYERDEPIAFPLGEGFVIPGWDEAVSLLPVGSKAKFIIEPELAYGESGIGGIIPPNATLYFDIELLDILPGSPEAPVEVAAADFTTTDSGLMYHDLAEGKGEAPEAGQLVSVHYTGWLIDGTKFDSSLDRGMPFVFPVGQEYVIPGMDEGLSTMKVGGKRQLVIPAEQAYGKAGAGDVIPADAELIFEVELLEIES